MPNVYNDNPTREEAKLLRAQHRVYDLLNFLGIPRPEDVGVQSNVGNEELHDAFPELQQFWGEAPIQNLTHLFVQGESTNPITKFIAQREASRFFTKQLPGILSESTSTPSEGGVAVRTAIQQAYQNPEKRAIIVRLMKNLSPENFNSLIPSPLSRRSR